MTDVLEGLNDEQRRAVEHRDGPMLVVAGAGTGKTQVITRRMAHLIATKAAKPDEILALTFTEKAAQEMSDRLMGLIGWDAVSVAVRTFNAFGSELMLNYAHHIGRSIRGGLINDTQKSLLLKQRISSLSLEYYPLNQDLFEFAETMVTYIGRLQNTGISSAAYRSYVDRLVADEATHPGDIAEQRDLALIYETYDAIKRETSTYDYYDQLAMPLEVLSSHPNLIERLRAKYRYVLVDEYQDTSPIQDALLRHLVPVGGNIFAVGDDDQAIYAFRGAELGNIMAFQDHFKAAAPIVLTQNYRSGQAVLDASYRLIRHNDPERLEAKLGLNKQLIAQRDDATVRYVLYQAAADEQRATIDELIRRVDGGEIASDFAVLARSNAVLRRYAKALRERNIPYAISTTVSVFEQREMINLWSLMQWICDRASDDAISSVVMGPFIGWSAKQLRSVVDYARREVVSLEEALRRLATDGDEGCAELVTRLDEWRELALEETISRCIYRLVFDYGLAERLKDQGDGRAIRVFDDLRRFLEQLQDYEATQILQSIGDLTLATYLGTFPKPPELQVTETEGEAGGVQLLTVHASKGLEFSVVFVVGLTLRGWASQPSNGLDVPEPLRPATDPESEIHEQRRLMYVAVTRAKDELIVTAPTRSAAGAKQAVSPLMTELAGESMPSEVQETNASGQNTMDKLQQFYPLKSQLPDTMPFETSDGWIELGVGDLERFSEHPHDFYLQNVLGIVRPFGPQLGFGTAVHGAIQALYEAQLRGETITAEAMTLRLDELWSDRGYESAEQAEREHARARETVIRFRERELAMPHPVKATELPIQLEIPEAKLRLRGRIDVLFEGDGGIEVRDFKTGNLRDEEKLLDRTKKSFQLRTYALAMEEQTGTAPALVTLDYVVTGIEASTKLTATVLKNHREKLVKLAAALRNREFEPGAPSAFNRSAAFRYYGTESDEDGSSEAIL